MRLKQNILIQQNCQFTPRNSYFHIARKRTLFKNVSTSVKSFVRYSLTVNLLHNYTVVNGSKLMEHSKISKAIHSKRHLWNTWDEIEWTTDKWSDVLNYQAYKIYFIYFFSINFTKCKCQVYRHLKYNQYFSLRTTLWPMLFCEDMHAAGMACLLL